MSNGKENVKPDNNKADDDEIESKSPATKLLKRRREMYQKQEEYEKQKDDARL